MLSVFTLGYNVLALGAVADFGVQNINTPQKLMRGRIFN